MKFLKAINILPIILALILPAIRFYSLGLEEFTFDKSVIMIWMYSSLVLYVLWYFLWQLWNLREGNRMRVAILLFGALGLLFALYFPLFDIGKEESPILNLSTIRAIPPLIVFVVIQYALQSQQKVSLLSLEKEQLQTENYKTQLQALHAKIDPHFLFNSLNTLRSMVRQGHDQSEKFILSLSDFYRQTLKYTDTSQLPVSEELEVMESYLFLMTSRNKDAVNVDLQINESLHAYYLPTLSLQIVLENCFKHNSMTASRPLMIRIAQTRAGYIEVSNNIQPKMGAVDSTGYGLDLLRKRYELMKVPDGVIVEETPDQFSVNLKLIQ